MALCGVNTSTWTLNTACDNPAKTCGPFDIPIANTGRNYTIKLPAANFPDGQVRALTPVDVIKGFTGVAYPMDIFTSEILEDMIDFIHLKALDVDRVRGFQVMHL